MSFLHVQDISIRLGIFHLNRVSMELEKDEYVAVIGPTGAGKTILLECIIGFYRPETGGIFLEGRDITNERPEKRRIGIVYQDYALLPNLTVFANIAYGLKKYIKDGVLVREKVEHMAKSLHISHILERHPETLSGGEQQRVALARSLVVEPKLLLMDEPFSALDPRTRREIRSMLKEIIARTGTSVIHITHDLDDAWSLADKVAFFSDGCLQQFGTLEEVFHRPATPQIADFVGATQFAGIVMDTNDDGSRVRVDDIDIYTSDKAEIGKEVILALRPEAVRIYRHEPKSEHADSTMCCTLESMENECNMHYLVFSKGKMRIPVMMTANGLTRLAPRLGEAFFVQLDTNAVRLCYSGSSSG
ncbi:ATP-binding cassette domain-containing protein [Desulfoplanes sp. PS50]|jgi:molybdate transport system ATP-binding protein